MLKTEEYFPSKQQGKEAGTGLSGWPGCAVNRFGFILGAVKQGRPEADLSLLLSASVHTQETQPRSESSHPTHTHTALPQQRNKQQEKGDLLPGNQEVSQLQVPSPSLQVTLETSEGSDTVIYW